MKSKIIKTAGTEKYPFACVVKCGFHVTDRICSEIKAQKVLKICSNLDNIQTIKHKLAFLSVELRFIR